MNDLTPAAKLTLPELIAENGDWSSAGLIFFRSESASIRWANPGDAEEVFGDMCARHEHRPFWSHDTKVTRRVSSNRFRPIAGPMIDITQPQLPCNAQILILRPRDQLPRPRTCC